MATVLSATLPERSTAMAIREDILGYLQVLNSPEVLGRLTAEEHQIGRANLTGCFSRLMEVLEKDATNPEAKNSDHYFMFMRIQHREYLNAHRMLPVGHPELVAATEETASMLFEYLSNYLSPAIKQHFLNQLDEALTEILEKQTWRTQ